jgi:hypothetical protein
VIGRRGWLKGLLVMTFPGLGGQQPPPQNAVAAQQPVVGVTPGVTQRFVSIQAGNTIINPSGFFTYSGPPAAGNLISSTAPSSTTQDNFGNDVIGGGVASYGAGVASLLAGGEVQFLTGSLPGGWSLQGALLTDSSGDLLSTFTGALVLDGGLTMDNGSLSVGDNGLVEGNLTVDGTLSATLSGQTGTGLPAGTPTGGPNSGSFAGHTHDFDGHTHDL